MTLISGGKAKRKAPATTQAVVSVRILRKPEAQQKVGLSHSTIWRLEREGKFPKRLRLGGGACGWIEHEIDEWIAQRAAER